MCLDEKNIDMDIKINFSLVKFGGNFCTSKTENTEGTSS
jgi:hypothetical protein